MGGNYIEDISDWFLGRLERGVQNAANTDVVVAYMYLDQVQEEIEKMLHGSFLFDQGESPLFFLQDHEQWHELHEYLWLLEGVL